MLRESQSVLVVDDDTHVAEAHAFLLKSSGYRAMVQTDPEKVELQLVADPEIGAVLLDIRMPRLDGLELLRRIRLRSPHVGVVMATVVNDIDLAVRAIKSGAYNYLLKPLQEPRVSEVLGSYFANRPAQVVNDPRFSPFVTGCKSFIPIFHAVAAFASADVTVLLQGETGTGKEVIAQLIHALSPRAGELFTAVNVAAVTPTIFEAELFGHCRGAFTGATGDRPGFLERADNGTLFLDEIGELPADLQTKLLRVAQEKSFCRVGEAQPRPLHARLVFATNRDLGLEVKDGRFRADLFYRLAAHTITLPPLRDREGDVILLADYMLRKYRSQFGRSIQGFSPEALTLLQRYPFPGNVRELEGIVSAAVLLESSSLITPSALPQHVRLMPVGDSQDLEAVRYRAIMAALAACDGNQTKAAEKVGISRASLCRYLRDYRKKGLAV